MIDAFRVTVARKGAVFVNGPQPAPFGQALRLELLPGFPLPCSFLLLPEAGLFAEAIGANVAQRQEDVGMMIALVATARRGMDGNVGDDAMLDEFLLDKIADQLDPLLMG